MANFALGTVQWGQKYGIANKSGIPSRYEIAKILELARENGISTLDTASSYGLSEKILGELNVSSLGFRIITKISPNIYSKDFTLDETLKRLDTSLRTSLSNLNIEQIDTLLLHRGFHKDIFGGAIWHKLQEWKQSALVQKIGISAVNPNEAFESARESSVEVLQVASSLLDQRLIRTGFFELEENRGKEIFIRSVYLQGAAFLGLAELPKSLQGLSNSIKKINKYANELEVDKAQIWLNFAESISNSTLVLGFENSAQLKQSLKFSRKMNEEIIRKISNDVPNFEDRLLDPSLWRNI